MKNIRKLYDAVVNWNSRCGNKPIQVVDERFWESVSNQNERMVEEVDETQKAIEYKDTLEYLDGICDQFVILSYAIAQAQAAGFNVEGALEAVCANNDTKYTLDIAVAQKTAESYTEDGTECVVKAVAVSGNTYYCVRRKSDNKIMKPQGFEEVDLSKYLPRK